MRKQRGWVAAARARTRREQIDAYPARDAVPRNFMRVKAKHCPDVLLNPLRLVVYQREWRHDLAVAYVSMDRATRHRTKIDTPVKLTWGYRGQPKKKFFGYVRAIEPWKGEPKHTLPKGHQRYKVSVVGMSYRMRTRRGKVWKKRTAGYILRWYARQHFMVPCTSKELREFGRISQKVNESDWQFLVRMAQRAGCTLYANNTALYMYRRDIPPAGFRRFPVVLRNNEHHREIFGFSVVEHFAENAQQETGGVDIEKRKRYRIKIKKPTPLRHRQVGDHCAPVPLFHHKPAFPIGYPVADRFSQHTPTPAAQNAEEARREVKSVEERNAWPVTAEMLCVGDTQCHQGTVVLLSGVPDWDEGLWYVTSVKHVSVHGTRYRMYVELGRQGRGRQPAPDEELAELGPVITEPPEILIPEDDEPYAPDGPIAEGPDDIGREPDVDDDPVVVWPDPTTDPGDDVPEDEDIDAPDLPGVPDEAPPDRLPDNNPTGPSCPTQPQAVLPGEWRAQRAGPQTVRYVA